MIRIHGGRKKSLVDPQAGCVTLITCVRVRGKFHKVMKWLKCGFPGHEQIYITRDCKEWKHEGHRPSSSPLNCVVSIAVQVVKFGKCVRLLRDNYYYQWCLHLLFI